MRYVLLVPSFVVDTYSQIEESFIELSATKNKDFEFLWLVPDIHSKYNRFAEVDTEETLDEPLYVKHLKKLNIKFVVGNISKYNFIKNFIIFNSIFKKYDVAIVYTHFGFERYISALYAKIFFKKVVLNEHWYSLGTKFIFVKKIFYSIFIDYFISVSSFITSTLPKKSKIFTIKNSLPFFETEGLSQNEKDKKRHKLGLDKDKIIILMVASFTSIKRHDLAVEICKNVLSKRKDVCFVFLGQGELQTEIEELIKNAGISQNIITPGHVNNIDDYYSVADMCMLTSIGEAFGYTILEAFKYALPFVAFDSAGPSEIIQNGDTGFLIKPENTEEFAFMLVQLINDSAKRKLIGQNACQALKRDFSRERWIKEVTDSLEKILNS